MRSTPQRVRDIDIPTPLPEAVGPHTTLGGRVSKSTGEIYRQSATFPEGTWPAPNGQNVPWSRVDWTNHGRPEQHANPHQYRFYYDSSAGGWKVDDPSPF